MLLTQLRRVAAGPDGAFSLAADSPDGVYSEISDALGEADAELIEHAALRALPVRRRPSRFTAFLDGIQRSAVRLHHGPVPVVYAWVAAVVRGRRVASVGDVGRADIPAASMPAPLRTWRRLEREALFLPFRLIDPGPLVDAGVPPDALRDTSPPEPEPLPLFPPLIYALAARGVGRFREDVESELAGTWCRAAGKGEHLLVDGSLTGSPELAAHPGAIGVIKSHNTRFFDGDDARVLLGLRARERTSVFRPGTRRFTPVFSWYVRLRDPGAHGGLWGLVRVEAAATDATIDRADEISGWLLDETAPIALPDHRWDRMLYPIRDCEEYLRSRAPNP